MKSRRYFPRPLNDHELQMLAAFHLATEPKLIAFRAFYPLLLVENNIIDIQKARRALKRQHIANPLIVANDSNNALNMLYGKNNSEKLNPAPKIILLDIDTTGISQFLQKIYRDPYLKSSKIFILKDETDQHYKITDHLLNIAGYIRRPVDYDRLLKVLGLVHPWHYLH